MSAVSHTSEVIFELVDKTIEKTDEDEVVQVVTDNASNNMGGKKPIVCETVMHILDLLRFSHNHIFYSVLFYSILLFSSILL
jgi:hypothetical protein